MAAADRAVGRPGRAGQPPGKARLPGNKRVSSFSALVHGVGDGDDDDDASDADDDDDDLSTKLLSYMNY